MESWLWISFTQTQGFYENITFTDGINTNYTTTNGELGIKYADRNEGRLHITIGWMRQYQKNKSKF